MKLDPKLDPTPSILHGWIIEVRFLPATKHKLARIKAICYTGVNGNSRSLTVNLDYGNTTEQIKNLVVALIEKYNFNFLRNSVGKMSMSTYGKGWIVSLPV